MQQKIVKLGMRSNAANTKPPHPLERAALENDADAVSELIKEGVDINTKFGQGWTALHIASSRNCPEVVSVLLDHGADVEFREPKGSTPLHISSLNGHHEVVKVLLHHGARPDATRESDGFTPLHLAAARGRQETLKVLLDAQERYGLDVDRPAKGFETALQSACNGESLECMKILISAGANVDAIVDSVGRTPLMLATTMDRGQVAQVLLDAGADIDLAHEKTGDTAVIIASFTGHLNVLRTLISGGANLDVRDKNGYTPLAAAVFGDKSEAALLLLQHRVKVNITYDDHKNTALHFAVSHGLYDVVQALIRGGAEVEACDSDGDTALQWAVEKGDLEMCKILLRSGAQVNRPNEKTGEVVLHWAIRGGHVGVTELLLANKADKSFVDLDGVTKKESTDDEEFELCKALTETSFQTSFQTSFPESHSPGNTSGADFESVNIPSTPSARTVSEAFTPPTDEWETKEAFSSKDPIGAANSSSTDASSSKPVPSPLTEDEQSKKDSLQAPHSKKSTAMSVTTHTSDHALGVDVIETAPAQVDPRIRFQVWDIPGQTEAAEVILSKMKSVIEHKGVKCDGILCKEETSYIQGVRFRCVCCENTDFCLACVSSFHNNHDARHPMIRCLLPNDFANISEIDDDSKRQCIEAYGEGSLTVDNLSHIVYGTPDLQYLVSQIVSKVGYEIQPTELESLLPASSPSLFPVVNVSDIPIYNDIRKRGIIKDKDDRPGGIFSYKIDEAANVRVKQYHKDDDLKKTPREDDLLVHHQDPETLMASIFGKLQHYHYDEDRTFYNWAQENRLVTRVIDIMPGNFDDKMKIGIRVVDLKDSIPYEALSYTWKETTYERAIQSSWTPEDAETARRMGRFLHAVYCESLSGEERFLEINCGLRDALKRIRHQSEVKTFWIDQISINQRNLKERAYQVTGMRYFFNGANQVVLWVGEEEEDTREVFDIFAKIVEGFKRQGHLPDPDQLMADSELPSFESNVWESVLNLFDRPVFNRCWVIQEVVTAQKLVLHCGSFSILWADLAKVATALCHRSWLVKLPQTRLRNKHTGLIPGVSGPELSGSEPQDFELPGINNVVIMNELRDNFHCSRRATLTSLLFHTFPFEASDPRDKVYSILGIRIANPGLGHQHDIIPDYEAPVEQVFLDAAKACIMEEASFAICGINNGLSSKRLDLPSWVPDLTTKALDFSSSLCQPNTLNPYHACGDVPLIAAWPYADRPDLLVTSSIKVETIVSVSENFAYDTATLPKVIIEWTRLASSIGPDYPNGEFSPEAFCRTCVADVSGPLRHYPMPPELYIPLCRVFEIIFHRHVADELSDGKKEMDDVMKKSTNAVIATLLTDLYKVEDPEEEQNEEPAVDTSEPQPARPQPKSMALYNVALEAILLACRNRRFFATSNNFFGVSSKDIQPGDEVHVLSGAVVPFVLRQVPVDSQVAGDGSGEEKCLQAMKLAGEDGLDLYRMVGESYIHGFMQGESCERENAEWSGICIL